MHVCYNSWYISLPFPAKREMTNFCVVRRTGTTTADFESLISNLLMCPRFSFLTVLTVINKVMILGYRESRR